MAGASIPELELHPLGEDVSQESSISKQPLLDSPSQTATTSGLAGEPEITCQEKPKKVGSEDCKETSATPSSREIKHSCLKVSDEPGEKNLDSSENFVLSEASNHDDALTLTVSHQHSTAVKAVCVNPQDSRTLQSINQGSLPVQRSHSDTLSKVKEVSAHPPADSKVCGLTCHGGDHFNHEAHVCSVLSCRQPSQQCNIITTFSNSGQGGGPQPQSRCVCAETPARVEAIKDQGHSYTKCDNALCCGSYVNNVNFEDTFAAYCHPQPIPAPSQLLPRLAGAEASCDIQRAVEPPSAINHLTLPRLISSVSETGLNAKHLLRCCSLNCSWVSNLPPGAGPQSQKHFGLDECCSGQAGAFRTTTREMGTMTAHKELRDVGVQAGPTATPHVFPEICLAEESRDEISHSQSLNTDSDGHKIAVGAPKSPVKEVKWDAEGMTWEVYGASVDPEELGIAIQRHLELQIRETANRAAKLSRQNTNTSRQSGNNGCQRKKSRMMGSFRPPACCARTTTAVD